MMIDPGHPRLSIVQQCELVCISRAAFYRQPADESDENLTLMRLIDATFLECYSTAPSRWRSTCGGLAGASAASACGV
jgi:hypothetical protein